ncbi:MAG: 50S ribosomal protein L32 [Oscillospiraceae bacterium]|nr:50S ribosomal protein L32 [Oscillospiraceae bacterium]
MVAPVRKSSKQRRNLRRSSVWKLEAPVLSLCQCGEYKLSHRACKACGTYRGRTVILKKDDTKKKK